MPANLDPSKLNDLFSPSLVIDRAQVRANLEGMVRFAGGADRLRPHVKTHKMPAIVKMCEELGVHKHKCATIAEAEMVAAAGGKDILLAYPLVGPNIARFRKLRDAYPGSTFRVLADHPDATRALSAGFADSAEPLSVLVDIEVGMGRTGIAPDQADDLYALIDSLPGLKADGISAYDGHVNAADLDERAAQAAPGIAATFALRKRLEARGFQVPRIVFGGTPSFAIHAKSQEPGIECSPGTCTLHDIGYWTKHPDLPFKPAAYLLTRVISHPRLGRLCLDLGHKAVAADPPGARLTLLDVPDAKLGGQSEEHLVVDVPDTTPYPPGTPLLAIPMHICPTCALHRFAYVVEDGQVVDRWEVGARDRVLNF